MRILLFGLVLAGIASGQSQSLFVSSGSVSKQSLPTEWRWSAASLAAAQVADAASSWRLQERNPLLRSGSGEFGYKGAAIKGATAAGMLLLEARFIRRHPDLARPFTVLNFVAAGVTSGIAVRNWRLR